MTAAKRSRAAKAKAEPTVYVVIVPDDDGTGQATADKIERMALHPLHAAPRTTKFGPRIWPFRVVYRFLFPEPGASLWWRSCRGRDHDGSGDFYDDVDAIQWLLEGEAHHGG